MNYTKNQTGTSCEVLIDGKFTFSDHSTFREIISLMKTGISSISLDLSKLEFVDSAALGMFLLAREEAGKNGVTVTLKNPQGQVKKMFSVSKFESLFNII